MRKKQALRLILLIGSLVLLTGCSTVTEKKEASNSDNAMNTSAATEGAGDLSSFGEGEGAYASNMKVANQSYYFDFNLATVRESDIPSIKVQANYLNSHPTARILLAGNTDERGSREYNIGLGNRRASSVMALLIAQGVDKKQITLVSYGAEKPIAFGHTENDYSKNRRTDLIYQQAIGNK